MSSRSAFAALVRQPRRVRRPRWIRIRISRPRIVAGAGTAARTARIRSTACIRSAAHAVLPVLAGKWKLRRRLRRRTRAGTRASSSRRLRGPAQLRRLRVRSKRRAASARLAGKRKLLGRALLPRFAVFVPHGTGCGATEHGAEPAAGEGEGIVPAAGVGAGPAAGVLCAPHATAAHAIHAPATNAIPERLRIAVPFHLSLDAPPRPNVFAKTGLGQFGATHRPVQIDRKGTRIGVPGERLSLAGVISRVPNRALILKPRIP